MDAFLHTVTTGQPWRALPERRGEPDTASCLFRRRPHAGPWSRLLEALAAPDAPLPLRAMEYWLCRLSPAAPCARWA